MTAALEFTLHARNPERDVELGGSEPRVRAPSAAPAFVSDLDIAARAGNHADFLDYARA